MQGGTCILARRIVIVFRCYRNEELFRSDCKCNSNDDDNAAAESVARLDSDGCGVCSIAAMELLLIMII